MVTVIFLGIFEAKRVTQVAGDEGDGECGVPIGGVKDVGMGSSGKDGVLDEAENLNYDVGEVF